MRGGGCGAVAARRVASRRAFLPCVALLLGAAAPTDPRAPPAIVAAAPASAWQAIPPVDLLVMTLAGGRRVVVQLAPDFSPVHVANIRALARGGWFDGNSITRVQDDYVVQWGGADASRQMPPGVVAHPPAEYDRPLSGLAFTPLASRDSYAARVGFADGWPVASDGARAWLPHCYAMVGVGRDMPPDTGDGSELYAVIGQAPRQLDRNIVLAGRVIEGIDALSSLPRGGGAMGFYGKTERKVPIQTVRIASDMPPDERPAYQAMRADSASFADYAQARAERRDRFFVRPAGGVDICNVPVPVRSAV